MTDNSPCVCVCVCMRYLLGEAVEVSALTCLCTQSGVFIKSFSLITESITQTVSQIYGVLFFLL